MTDKNIGKKTLESIKDQNIKPRPKWEFMLRNYFIWFVSFLSLLVGGLSFAMILYMLDNSYGDVYSQAGVSVWGQIWLMLPYFWVILLLLFIFLVFYNFKHTEKGYKFRIPFILSMSVLGSIVLGLVFYGSSIAGAVDRNMASHVPGYGAMCNCDHKQELWLRPQEGFLAGIVQREKGKGFDLSDLKGKMWFIDTQEARIRSAVRIEKGEPVKVIGERTAPENFQAQEVRRGSFGCMMHHHLDPRSREGVATSSCPIMESGPDTCGHGDPVK